MVDGGARLPRLLHRHQDRLRADGPAESDLDTVASGASILLAALVLTKPRSWWLLLLAAFPAHLAGQAESGVPAIQVIAWFITNCSEALIGAGSCIGSFGARCDLIRSGTFAVSVLLGTFFAPFVSSFIDVAFVTAIGWGQGSYTTLWKTRFFSNMLTSLVLVPVIVTWVTLGSGTLRTARVQRVCGSRCPTVRTFTGELHGICSKHAR